MAKVTTRAFRSLRNRNVRLFLTGHAISVVGTWMQRVAQDWLLLELSGDATIVGIGVALQFVPVTIFGLWGGALVDRYDRRRLVISTQVAQAMMAASLAAMVLLDMANIWVVFALALCMGFITVFDVPGRTVLVADLAGTDDYVNAQGLASTVHNLGRFVGPAIAGLLIALVGAGWVFAINAISFVPVVWGLLLIDATVTRDRAKRRDGAGTGQVREAITYVMAHPELRSCVFLIAVVATLAQNYRAVFPLMAKETFGGGPEVYGWMTAAIGIGAVIGAVGFAASEKFTYIGFLATAVLFSAMNLVVAIAPWLWFALGAMVLLGVGNIVFNNVARTLLQLGTDPVMHGRVMALYALLFTGTTPLGMPFIGWICDLFGPRYGLVVGGSVSLLATILLLLRIARLRAAMAARAVEAGAQ